MEAGSLAELVRLSEALGHRTPRRPTRPLRALTAGSGSLLGPWSYMAISVDACRAEG